MSKKISNPTTSYSTSSKPEVKGEVKVENIKLGEVHKVRPGSFSELISQ